ncbi:MAG: hypothetical protein CL608_28770 [Anaerolineaceae bacterium]|nr:hypothetical protein [Anaerolineaceae bacterium]
MAGEEIYIARLGAWIARALGDTTGFTEDLDTDALGLVMPEAVSGDNAVQAAGVALADAGGILSNAASELDAAIVSGDQSELVSALLSLVEGVYLFVNALVDMGNRIEAAAAGLPAAERDAVLTFAGLMARKTIDHMVLSLLARELPQLAFLLNLVGLAELQVVEASNDNPQQYVRKELKLEQIKDLVSDPITHLAATHGWGTDQFDPAEIMDMVLSFYEEETAIEAGKDGDDAFIRYGGFLWKRDSSVSPPGIMLDLSASVEQSLNERVEFSEEWGTSFESTISLSGGAIFRLQPPFEFSVEPKTGNAGGAIKITTNRNTSAQGFTIIGGIDLLGLTANDVGIGAELTIGADTTGQVQIDPGVFADLKGLTLTLGSEGSDNFLASLLAEADIQGVFDIGLAWSLSEGLVVKAAGGLEIAIPMHQDLGIVSFDTLYIILKIRDDGSFALEASAGITGLIGPLSATVERMGIEVVIAFSNGADAAFGPVDLALSFKPPSGVGLSIDAGAVKGGGYLYLDYEKGEYAGALELVFSEFLALKAIGLINTKMPDGSDGYSLLIVITAEFGTPIQLGFGFVLIGVGGLLGLNRTMMLEELAEGVRTGAVESVMFPQDVIANIAQILSDMRRFFPPEEGIFLIGPMAKLGWGTPVLVTASVGIIIEVPPGNIAILGVLKCVLPDEEAALLVLQVKFIGALEVDKSRLWFFASLYGSRVLFITIGGEMGLLIAWGDNAEFVLSVGGFHPKFNPPPLPFPSPMRVSLSILDTSFARIRVEGYFAVTSNTAQFGAAVELFFGLSEFSVSGHLSFDALFQFSPFYFIISFSASMSVKVFGAGLFSVRIRGELEGTSPWHFEGEGSISVLFWDISVPVSHTWGDLAETVNADIAALPLLVDEFTTDANWLALPPSGSGLSVSLRKIDPTQELVLHPVGALRISQRRIPLDLEISKVGNQKISDISKAVLKVVDGGGLVAKAEVQEPFATAQFRDIDNAISAPGYENYTAGTDVTVPGTDVRTSHAVKRVVKHELIIIDNNFKEHIQHFFNVGLLWFRQLLSSNATARSPLSMANRTAKVPFNEGIVAAQPGYVIANAADNTAWGGAATFSSQAQAQDALAAQIKTDWQSAEALHVIPASEVREAT